MLHQIYTSCDNMPLDGYRLCGILLYCYETIEDDDV